MRIAALILLLTAATCFAQEESAGPQAPMPAPVQSPAAPDNRSTTLPAGTRIPLSLTSPITTQARAGNSVRAVTGFPVSVGTQLAIPIGTYAEGVIEKVTKGGRSGPTLRVHFTRLLFANGYSVSIEGASTQAKVASPRANPPEVSALGGESVSYNSLAAEPSPQTPALQPPASHVGAIIGVGIGGAVAVAVTTILLARHHGVNGVLFDAGWQFEIVLQNPVSIDAARIGPAGSSGS